MTVFSVPEDLLLPEQLARQYEIRSCLKFSEQAATYLLRDKRTDRLYLLKTASDPVFADLLTNENRILEFIHQGKENRLSSTFPSPVSLAFFTPDGEIADATTSQIAEPDVTLFYIRTFIEGKTLEELCEMNYKKPGLAPEQALDYLIALTELLDFLHTMNPPLIHRDIKPQNVVIDSEGICHFIDLGISRFYGSQKRGDTMIMGTKLTAPPEQFGYQQTDVRSDLYSLGILLYYCLTGEYEITDHALAEFSPSLRLIIRKATMFDPRKRYQSAKELLPDLVLARYGSSLVYKKKPKFQNKQNVICAFLLLCTLLLTGLLAFQTRYNHRISSELEQHRSKTSEYVFSEPLIEEAVRLQLALPDGPITRTDLGKITELHIFGLQIYSDESEVWLRGEYPCFFTDEYEKSGLYTQKGTIRSLEDILNMPNLDTLCLYRQQIEDISVLKDTKIRTLGLGYNPLTDLSPLTDNPNITSLLLPCVKLSDTAVLASLSNLHTLNISNTGIRTLGELKQCPIEKLNLYQLTFLDFTELSAFESLTDLTLDHITPDQLSILSNLGLTRLEIHNSDHCSLEDFSIFPNLHSLEFYGTGTGTFRIGQPDLPKLLKLGINQMNIEQFTGMERLTQLEQLDIYGSVCSVYDGLDQIPNLKIISCIEQQYLELDAQYPDAGFFYIYPH